VADAAAAAARAQAGAGAAWAGVGDLARRLVALGDLPATRPARYDGELVVA
jgi:hypothetical protein